MYISSNCLANAARKFERVRVFAESSRAHFYPTIDFAYSRIALQIEAIEEDSPFPPWNILWFTKAEFWECAGRTVSEEIEERIAEEWIERLRWQERVETIKIAGVDTAAAAGAGRRFTVRVNFNFAGTISTDRATNAVNIWCNETTRRKKQCEIS